jgi:hypothetical protein
MNRFVSSMAFAALSSLVLACGANPPAAKSAASEPQVIDRDAPPQSASCPAPKSSTDACALVMVYVKVGDACCAYGNPCEAADGKTFSDDKCSSPT